MTMIYLAARYHRYPELQGYAQRLEALGYPVTSRWIRGDHEHRAHGLAETDLYLPQWAHEDYEDLMAAQMVVSFTEGPGTSPGRSRGGRHVEMGLALASYKACVVIGYRENVFHWLPQVDFYPTWEEFYIRMCIWAHTLCNP
jgi:predicted alpha/beta hydrolase